MFHTETGCNVALNDACDVATWTPCQTSGLIFSDRPLTPLDKVTVNFKGSGAAELAITTTDPASFKDVPDDRTRLADYLVLNDVKIHKRSCHLDITLDAESKVINTMYGDESFSESSDGEKSYYIVVDVKFGKLEITLDSNGAENQKPLFAEVHGRNIKRLNNPAMATSIEQCPASLCFHGNVFNPGRKLRLLCSQENYQGTVVGRHCLTIGLTTYNPDEFFSLFPSKMSSRHSSSDDDVTIKNSWTKIVTLVKNECTDGDVIIKRTNDEITVTNAIGGDTRATVPEGRIWLVLELYGVRVRSKLKSEGIEARAPIPPDPVENKNTARKTLEDPVSLADGIQRNFIDILLSLHLDEFLDHLFQGEIITYPEMLKLQDTSIPRDNAKRILLLHYLFKRPVSKKAFLDALETTGQGFLIEKFLPRL